MDLTPVASRIASIGHATAEEVRWACPTCGVIEPRQIKYNGRWIRNACACEIATRKAQEAAERRYQEIKTIEKATYTWLGGQWSDMALSTKTFENFQAERQQEGFDLAQLFAKETQGTLILHGSYGTGKTHLLAAICNDMRLHLKESRFTTAPKLFKAIQERIQFDESYTQLIRHAISTPLLVIDDIDKAKHSEFREEIYFEIIDERTKAGKPIAISTNRLDDLALFVGGAVCSRLLIGQIAVPMNGADYRIGM